MSPDLEEAPQQRGLVLLTKAERLIADLGPAIDKIPRHQRYRYATRLEDFAAWFFPVVDRFPQREKWAHQTTHHRHPDRPQHTSQTCPSCNHVSKENRKNQADFECVGCGFKANADVVGAVNVLARGHRVLACGDSRLLESAKQEPKAA